RPVSGRFRGRIFAEILTGAAETLRSDPEPERQPPVRLDQPPGKAAARIGQRRAAPAAGISIQAVSALDSFFTAPVAPQTRLTLSNAPEGRDAQILGDLAAKGQAAADGTATLLHVCRDDGRLARLKADLAFFHPDLTVSTFPAWDCLPYDRVSPNPEIMSSRISVLAALAGRIDTLANLAGAGPRPWIVLTTVNAAVQRVPPRKLFEDRAMRLAKGEAGNLDWLRSFLGHNGYNRTDMVREPGEYAVRGGIVDVYPAGAAAPLRLDFLGDLVENIRSFDALSQRSTGTLESVELRPTNEVLLDERVIERFRSRYRQEFGASVQGDPLYESVSAGRRSAGMEHWLPLYYESLETIFDYLPGAALSLDHQAEEVRADRLETIADFYAARLTTPAPGAPVYR